MKKTNKLTKTFYIFILALLVVSLAYLNFRPSLAAPAAAQTVSSIPWYVARAAGLAAYGLMFLVIIFGTGMTTGYVYKYINPIQAWVIHKYLGLALGITLLTHVTAFFFDKFIGFSWQEILIPFASNFKPLFLSMGIIGFYFLLVILLTSLFIRLKYQRIWRGIHYAVYPLFIFSFIHGLFIGTDSQTFGMQIIYLATGLIILGSLIYRFIIHKLLSRF